MRMYMIHAIGYHALAPAAIWPTPYNTNCHTKHARRNTLEENECEGAEGRDRSALSTDARIHSGLHIFDARLEMTYSLVFLCAYLINLRKSGTSSTDNSVCRCNK